LPIFHNYYVAKVKSGKHSLVLPLGAKATLSFIDDSLTELKGNYTLKLLDISGVEWETKLNTE
ncbi:MAG: TQO small subunit DoxA domain-containing protein, partial [Flavobacteriaceae bacterium]